MLHSLSLLSVTALGLFQSTCAGAQSQQSAEGDGVSHVPSDYYATADGKQGKALKVALGDIARQHTVFGYGELWYHYEVTDVVPGTEAQVFDYYSPAVHYFTGTGAAAQGMNKEHACPQSWWGGGALCEAYSDLFNVMPSETKANEAKSNFPLGVVSAPRYENACMKVGPSARSEYSGSVFEPCDEYKGDFARIYFYVATTYADAAWGAKESVANTVAFAQEAYPTIRPWLLDLLLQWNAQDPVSEWEVTRNERVYAEQGNRNPYIDYPQLADYVWGDSTQYAFDVQTAIINGTGSGHGSGIVPGDDPGTGGGDDPNPGDNTDPDADHFEAAVGTVLLTDDFASAAEGNDYETTGSATPWAGNEHFPEVAGVFQAGGAIKLGSSKQQGSITSCALGNAAGVKLLVELKVKGWSKVEGELLVSLAGQEAQSLPYTATMSDSYQTVTLTIDDCPANAQLTISHSAKRVFISAVRVSIADGGSQALHQVRGHAPTAFCYNLLGQPLTAPARGMVIQQGHIIML